MDRDLTTFEEGEDRVKISHFTKKGYDIKGIVHVGTNDWYEYPFYKKMGINNIVGFEPIHEAVERARKSYPEAELYEVALGNHDGYEPLHIANGDAQSSTFLTMTKGYREEFPNIHIVKDRMVQVKKFRSWMDENPKFNLSKYNCLVLDVEGYELQVLRGMGLSLRHFDFLNIECSGIPTYEEGPFAQEIIDWLVLRGFKQDSPIEAHNDIFFIKEGK